MCIRDRCATVKQGGELPADWYGACWPFIFAKKKFLIYGRIPTEECAWNIGGKSYDAVEFINEIISGQIEPEYNYAESA